MQRKKRFIIIIIIFLLLLVFGIIISVNYIKKQTKIKEQERYAEIKNDIDKELERYMYVIAPKCYPENGSPLITHQDLVYNAGMNKDKLLDIDEKSYCKVYVKTKCVEYGKWEWNTMISCKNYKDKGFFDWDKGFEPKQ